MMHRHTTLWRVTGVLFALVVLGLPAGAAQHHRFHRTARAVPKASRKSHSVHQKRSRARSRVAARKQATRRASRAGISRGGTVRRPRTYTVQPGDTLEVIATRVGTSQQALATANHLRNANRLSVGQVLKVPGARRAPEPKATGEACDSSSLVKEALRYRGVPYQYAGTSSRGMDCSGLVSRVLMTHGIRAPHNAASLYKLGTPVQKANLQAGDLVFFNTRGRGISHVGIYIGKGEFVHASSGSGRVTTSQLTEGYYQLRYVGARRLTK